MGRWYQCVKDEYTKFEKIDKPCKALGEVLYIFLPFEIRRNIEEEVLPDELQEGMQAAFETYSKLWSVPKNKPLPNPVCIKFLLSLKFLRPYQGNLRYQQRLSFLERKGVSLWINCKSDSELNLDFSLFLEACK